MHGAILLAIFAVASGRALGQAPEDHARALIDDAIATQEAIAGLISNVRLQGVETWEFRSGPLDPDAAARISERPEEFSASAAQLVGQPYTTSIRRSFVLDQDLANDSFYREVTRDSDVVQGQETMTYPLLRAAYSISGKGNVIEPNPGANSYIRRKSRLLAEDLAAVSDSLLAYRVGPESVASRLALIRSIYLSGPPNPITACAVTTDGDTTRVRIGDPALTSGTLTLDFLASDVGTLLTGETVTGPGTSIVEVRIGFTEVAVRGSRIPFPAHMTMQDRRSDGTVAESNEVVIESVEIRSESPGAEYFIGLASSGAASASAMSMDAILREPQEARSADSGE